MYEFKNLKSVYNINIRYRKPDYTQFEYSTKLFLSAKKNKQDFLFTLEQRIDTMLNRQPPRKIMDKLMLELGNSLYPIELNVNPKGSVISINNFKEIKERWIKKSKELYNKNKTQAFSNYLQMSAENIVNETMFIKSLFKDTFIQMYFLNFGSKIIEFEFANFPMQSRKASVYAIQTPFSKYNYTLESAFKEKDMKEVSGTLSFSTGEMGVLWDMTANLVLESDKEEFYYKHVSIKVDKDTLKTKTNFFF